MEPSTKGKAPHAMSALVLSALLCLCAPAALQAIELSAGSAIVTSRSGSSVAMDASGHRVSTDLHSVRNPAGLSCSTQRGSRLFLAFSNGVALALDGETSAKCLDYAQRPFGQDALEPGREPSVSKLRLQLETGRIALASNRLSPLSELRIELPFGEVRLHQGTCLIEYDSTGLHLSAIAGNMTFYYPDSDAREYVSAPKRVRISEQSARRQQIAEASTTDTLPPGASLFSQAAQHASQRVHFLPNEETGQPPEPLLIVKPNYFDQAPIRPYQFKD